MNQYADPKTSHALTINFPKADRYIKISKYKLLKDVKYLWSN